MAALKEFLKQYPWIVRLAWRWHVLRDEFFTRFWKRTTATRTPLGFTLISGAHPAYSQMRKGTFEPQETAAILSGLKSADIFVDVGANLGYYSLLALKHGVRVIAFEPQPQNLRCLQENVAANNFEGIEIHPVALAAEPGEMVLYGSSGPSASLLSGWAGYSPTVQQVVVVSTLDTALRDAKLGRLFVKIDVEGAEFEVLRGATETLDRQPRPEWLLEICLREFHPGGNPNYLATFDLFFSRGYRAFIPDGPEVSREEVVRWEAAGKTAHGGFNYVFR